jgi:integrase
VPKLKRIRPRAKGEGTLYKRLITRDDGSTYERWEAAVSLGYDGNGILQRNPVESTEPFTVAPRADTLWSNSEVLLFLATAQTHRLYAAFYLALATGMRYGEVLGLRWQDIQDDLLYVKQTLINIDGNITFSTPKTERSVRRIVLDPDTIATLNQHRIRQQSEAKELGNAWQPDKHLELVFVSDVGTPINSGNFYRTWYMLQNQVRQVYISSGQTDEEKALRNKQIEEKKVFSHLRFHDLRHMHVSLLNKAGVDARTIADRIGHTDAAFTLKRYAHVFEDQRKAAAIPLQTLLSSNSMK